MDRKEILAVRNLTVHYQNTGLGVENIQFSIARGQVSGILGESGCGKTTVCNAILGLLNDKTTTFEGSVRLAEKDILHLSWSDRSRINGKEIGVILQDPFVSFDPCMRISGHFIETLCTHLSCGRKNALLYGIEMLAKVGLPDGNRVMSSYAHQLSGGMLQRIMIALAISLNPVLIIADEPTAALDASSRHIIINLLQFVMREYKPAMLLVSHDIGVLKKMADEIVVMRDGRIIETGPYLSLEKSPKHAYTRELFDADHRLEEGIQCFR